MKPQSDAHEAAAVQLIVAHRRFLDAAIDVLRQVIPQMAATFDRPSPLVLLTLAMRLVQRGTAAHALCVNGYARDADPVLRSMLSALASITYVAAADSEGRALAFLADEVRISRNLIPRVRDQALLTPDEADRLLRQTEEFNAARVEHFAALGIDPDKPDRPGRSWHGYPSDEQFFAAIGLKDEYDASYARLSEDSHGSAWSLLGDIQALARGDFTFGPIFGNTVALRYAIGSSYKFVSLCLGQVDAALGLRQGAVITAATGAMQSALRAATPDRGRSV
jgi:Family of unknown function (DUF5677)